MFMLNNEMIKSLVKFSQYLEESEINVNDCQFKVLTQDEINDEFYDYQMSLFDELGLSSFSDWALNYILDNFDIDVISGYDNPLSHFDMTLSVIFSLFAIL